MCGAEEGGPGGGSVVQDPGGWGGADCFHERGTCWVWESAVTPVWVFCVGVTADGVGGVGEDVEGFVEPFPEENVGG